MGCQLGEGHGHSERETRGGTEGVLQALAKGCAGG